MMLFSSRSELVYVIGGTFQMGCINGERDEKPVHSVTLDTYSIGKYPITVGQYKVFCLTMGYRYGTGLGDFKSKYLFFFKVM